VACSAHLSRPCTGSRVPYSERFRSSSLSPSSSLHASLEEIQLTWVLPTHTDTSKGG